ncbi:uncharacterized protein F4822DRAFT_445783 [Hypoxylon trugodes]|uniref:uncharacterized protein n=1 Tax=Hypoxylon trugodes TaxID=326681 RepID=UPI00218F5412|nr:uncharacterized protein F4822DRAFT_445783 [Hypoxylon trugodes]KAI1385986.1 hypothetical protein F4822DRAFT_445783 [Hypoxylon trugodes]
MDVSENNCKGVFTHFFEVARPASDTIKEDYLGTPAHKCRMKFISSLTERLQTITKELHLAHKQDIISFVTASDSERVDFCVDVLENEKFGLLRGDRSHLEHPIPDLPTPTQLLCTIEHLSGYYKVLNMTFNPTGDQENNVAFELGTRKDGKRVESTPRRRAIGDRYDDDDNWSFQSCDGDRPVFTVANGDCVMLRVKNNTPFSWKIVIMVLGSLCEIEQLYPGREGTKYEELGPYTTFDMVTSLKKDHPFLTSETNFFKVFFSRQPINFRWMELPALEGLRESPTPGPGENRGRETFERKIPAKQDSWDPQVSCICKDLQVDIVSKK